jgi:hypothetical protein
MTLADILAAIKEQLDWTGPNEKKMGHIVVTRDQAEYLHRAVIAIIMERDQLLFEKENPS